MSKEKRQSIITLRHEGQAIRKMSRTLKVSSNAVAKTIKRYDETVSHEDHHKKGRELPLQQRTSSLELPASEIAAQINASQSSSNRHISTSTVQRRLRESDLHGSEETCLGQETRTMDIRPVEICPLF